MFNVSSCIIIMHHVLSCIIILTLFRSGIYGSSTQCESESNRTLPPRIRKMLQKMCYFPKYIPPEMKQKAQKYELTNRSRCKFFIGTYQKFIQLLDLAQFLQKGARFERCFLFLPRGSHKSTRCLMELLYKLLLIFPQSFTIIDSQFHKFPLKFRLICYSLRIF